MQDLKEKIEKACEAAGVKVNVQELDGRLVVDRLKEWKRWKPEVGECYFFVDSDGFIETSYFKDHFVDLYRYNTRNCFRTKEEAEAKGDADLLKAKILDRVDELNEGWEADWEDLNQRKYYPYYDEMSKKWNSGKVRWTYEHPFYLKSSQACQTLIDEFGDDLKVFFHN